ncbi:cyclic nucleotide-binding domain-containing protein [Legionella sp. CNM-4043-24]|uniref:cyclic nucleotide-binding domain-containing protein n=1 Tax=Legionella sp. CNM-4043-24 TaxID=3421646 RepID=UPI00403B1859
MYVSAENRKKLTLCAVLIALSTMSLVLGRTLSNTLLLTQYHLRILPWFYIGQSAFFILVMFAISICQNKYPERFALIYKTVVSAILVLLMAGLHFPFSELAFITAVILWTFSGISSIIALNYASRCFDVQEFKQYNWVLQLTGTLGAVGIGLIMARIPLSYDRIGILSLMLLVELLSILCILPLSIYQHGITQDSHKSSPGLLASVRQNTLFKYLALIMIASAFLSVLIDYNFKLALATEIEEKNLTNTVNLIYVTSIVCTLMVQVFLQDRLVQKMGSKKIVIFFPLAMLISALAAVFYPGFTMIAVLFIINQVASSSVFTLSEGLYISILPQGIRHVAHYYLDGSIKSFGIMLAGLAVFVLVYFGNQRAGLIFVIVAGLYAVYLCRHAITAYTVQLTESVYLRRFNPDLIEITERDDREIEHIFSQSLQSQSLDAQFFALQLLSNYTHKRLPASLETLLLLSPNPDIQKGTARLLAAHRDQREFEKSASEVFIHSHDDSVRWFLCLYLLNSRPDFLMQYAAGSQHQNSLASTCIRALIYLKLGNIQQHITALQQILALYQSDDYARKKWFLRLLREMPDLHDDVYLIKIINEGELSLKVLAIQQIGSTPSPALVACLIEHIGVLGLRHTLNDCLVRLGDGITPQIAHRLHHSHSYSVKTNCLLILSLIMGEESERCLLDTLRNTPDMMVKTIAAKYLAYHCVKKTASERVNAFLSQGEIMREISLYQRLHAFLPHNNNRDATNEINARIALLKKRVLFYFAALSGSVNILNSVPLLSNPQTSKNQRAIALELIDNSIRDRKMVSSLLTLFTDQKIRTAHDQPCFPEDPLLETCLHNIESQNMESIYLLTKLRRLDLFKNLSAETLLTLVKCCVSMDMMKDEIIFREGDPGDGLYLIDSGEVIVSKEGKVISRLTEGEYFGEMALLDDAPRYATITAGSEGALIFISKQDFDSITDEVPDIMKSIVKQVIHYLTGVTAGDKARE